MARLKKQFINCITTIHSLDLREKLKLQIIGIFRGLTLRPFSGKAQNREGCVCVSSCLRPRVRNTGCYCNTLLIMNINQKNIIALYPDVLSKN